PRPEPHGERVFSVSRLMKETVRLRPWRAFQGNRSQKEIMREVRARMRKYTDLRTSARNIGGFNIGGGSWDINFVFRGPDLKNLSSYAERLVARQESLGIMEADTTLKLDKPELRVQIDRARAADLRVDPERVGTAVRLMVGGDEEVSRFRDPGNNEEYMVQLRLREEDRADPGAIGGLYVPREDGGIVQIGSVAQVEEVKSASRIDRLDRQREVRLRGSVAPGYALADRIAALRAAVEEMNLPAGYTTSVSGRGRELERTFVEFVWAFALSFVFMYMILASQFESLVYPLIILLSIPLAVPFALLSVWLMGNTLNLYSTLGILVLFGVVKKNAILQIDHMNNLRAAGMDRDAAIRQGNRDRLRPILMTTMTFVAGMLPLAVGTGPGSEERRVIAVVVIGGQTLSLLLTLLATPVAYSYLDDFGAFLKRRSSRGTSP
ncbi:MAG: efflux RND transporter permease subunit, partial [Deltaproteobacteria bacterium]|nr:efflux RND transporter permease subunit [Deltaproteobacteria bacterium]